MLLRSQSIYISMLSKLSGLRVTRMWNENGLR